MRQAESAADKPAARKHALDFLGRGAGGHIEVLGHLAEQQVANAAANDEGLEAGLLQVANDIRGMRAEFLEPDPMLGLGNGYVGVFNGYYAL
jgi:hypothetical protein